MRCRGAWPTRSPTARRRSRSARLSANRHDLFWALFELGWAHYFSGDLDAAIAACRESAEVGGRMTGGTMPSAGGGPGWALGVASFEAGEHDVAFEILDRLGGEDQQQQIPVERCFDLENLALAALARDRLEEADRWATLRRGERRAPAARCSSRARSRRARAPPSCWPRASRPPPPRRASARSPARQAIGAGLQVAFSRALQGHALVAAGERKAAIAAWRAAEHELDAAGRSASATRSGAGCASSARGSSRAARRPVRTRAWAR